MKKLSLGFTLIELLIVIALLGALATGLLATVDPFEQLKKGRDTSTRNTAAEFYNSVIRYYAQRAAFPTSMTSGMAATGLNTLGGAITDIANAGELKTDFLNLAGTSNVTRIKVTVPSSEQIIVCFQPESKSFRNDQNNKYDNTGGTSLGTACPNGTSTTCHLCFQ